MTEQEFQKTVLHSLQKQEKINDSSFGFQNTVLHSLQKQEKINDSYFEFQKTVLHSLQKQEKINDSSFEFQKTVLNSLQKQEEVNSEQKKENNKFSQLQKVVLNSLQELKDRVTTLEVCTENQFTEQRVFEEKLAVVIENQIVDRISAENDVFKCYTDKKVKRHEVKFRHKSVA